jgi:signal transduction histidine kinase
MEPSRVMTDSRLVTAPGAPSPSPLTAVGSLVAARDVSELALAAALIPAQLFGARETVVVLRAPNGDIVERQPRAGGADLERWARAELGSARADEPSRDGPRLAVAIDAPQGWSGVIALDVGPVDAKAADEGTTRGVIELGRIVSRCVGQMASLERRATALADARQSIGKGLHDLRTPLNSLRLGLHLLEPGLKGQDPQVVQRTHRAVDRLASLVTEMYEVLNEKTATP